MKNEPIEPTDSGDAANDLSVAELQVMLTEADAAEAPAIAERIASLLGESLDASVGDDPKASP